MSSTRLPAIGVLLALLGTASFVQAQEGDAADTASAEKKKLPFALFVEVGRGTADADELDASIETLAAENSRNFLDLDGQDYSRAAIGWKLPQGKGDFRLVFNGYRESGYEFRALGRQNTIDPDLPIVPVSSKLDWWTVSAKDGRFVAEQTPPQWTAATIMTLPDGSVVVLDPGTDDNLNGRVDRGEEFYLAEPAVRNVRRINDDLQNRLQTTDLLYGRTFGGRRYSGRWWAGVRSFRYDGNVPAAAWLKIPGTQPGLGFTDGSNLKLLNLGQEASGYGPTGSLEARFNFLDQRLSLYAQAQAAFTILSLDVTTGDFITIVEDQDAVFVLPVRANLSERRTKSTWQDSLEFGARYRMRNGLELELAYSINGFLDIVLVPTDIRIPQTPQSAAQGTSALYNTRDYILQTWRGSVGFQF